LAILVAETPVPPAVVDPAGVWFFNWVIPAAGGIFIALAIADVIRRRRLTWGFLFLFNTLAMYWMENDRRLGSAAVLQPCFRRTPSAGLAAAQDAERPAVNAVRLRGLLGAHALLVLRLSQWVSSRFGWSMVKSMLLHKYAQQASATPQLTSAPIAVCRFERRGRAFWTRIN
jgi:hypothetical protein